MDEIFSDTAARLATYPTMGRATGRCRVRRLMREAALHPVWKREFIRTTDSRHDLPIAENLLDRKFEPALPNRAWVSDITYVRTLAG
jgi:putative transposase